MMTPRDGSDGDDDGHDGQGERVAVKEVTTCDVPRCGNAADTYVITADGVTIRVDLCTDHSRSVPVRRAIDYGRGAATTGRGRSASRTPAEQTLEAMPNLDDEDETADDDTPPHRPRRRKK